MSAALLEKAAEIPRRIKRAVRYEWDGIAVMPRLPLPLRDLPHDERWAAARNLNPYEQQEFTRQEIVDLMQAFIDQTSYRGTERTYSEMYRQSRIPGLVSNIDETTGNGYRQRQIRVGLNGVLTSDLAEPLKTYAAAPILNYEHRESWKDPEIQLEMTADYHTYKRAAATISLKVGEWNPTAIQLNPLGYSRNPLEGMGIHIDVHASDGLSPKDQGRYSDPRASVVPAPIVYVWDSLKDYNYGNGRPTRYDYTQSNLYTPFQDAVRHVKETPGIVIAGELIKLAYGVIAAQTRNPHS